MKRIAMLAFSVGLLAAPALAASQANPIVSGTTGASATQKPGVLTGLLSQFSNLFSSDFDEAAKLAISIPGLPDGVGNRCWANGWTPIGQVIKAHPLALTGHLATDAEARRIMIIALNNLCSNTDCTQVFTEEGNAVATLGLGIPIPSFTNLCAKVPSIRSTPVVPTPAEAVK